MNTNEWRDEQGEEHCLESRDDHESDWFHEAVEQSLPIQDVHLSRWVWECDENEVKENEWSEWEWVWMNEILVKYMTNDESTPLTNNFLS